MRSLCSFWCSNSILNQKFSTSRYQNTLMQHSVNCFSYLEQSCIYDGGELYIYSHIQKVTGFPIFTLQDSYILFMHWYGIYKSWTPLILPLRVGVLNPPCWSNTKIIEAFLLNISWIFQILAICWNLMPNVTLEGEAFGRWLSHGVKPSSVGLVSL